MLFGQIAFSPCMWSSTPLLRLRGRPSLSTGGGNLLFFLLLRRVGAGFGSFNNYLVPLMGVGWGFFLAGETPSWNALIALVLILTGLACARWLKPRNTPIKQTP